MTANAGVSFGISSKAYQSFRLEYPSALFMEIEQAGSVHMCRNLAVDLGSGTGISLPPLLQRFDRVIAVEPDARMAEKIPNHERLRISVKRAEEFDVDAASVDLITCATAFYWMDGPTVIDRMVRWLHPDGLIAVYRYGFPALPETVATIIHRELEKHWNTFRSPRLIDEEYTWRCFSQNARLTNQKRKLIPNTVCMNAATLTGFFSSTSYCSAYMRSTGSADNYLRSLQEEIEVAASGAPVQVDFAAELITASV